MLQNRLLGWHPGLFQQPALFVLTSIWLGHGSPWRFSCHWQTGRRANGSLGAGKVHNLSKVLNFPSWRKHVKCRLYRFVEFQSDKDVTAVLEKPAQSGKVARLRSAAGPPLSWRTATQRYCTNPGHCWFKRLSHGSSESHVTSSRIFKKQTTLKRFQGSFMRFVVKSTQWYFFLSIFRMSSGERRLNHGWSANSLSSCQLRRRFCPGMMLLPKCLVDAGTSHQHTLPHLDVELWFMKNACNC